MISSVLFQIGADLELISMCRCCQYIRRSIDIDFYYRQSYMSPDKDKSRLPSGQIIVQYMLLHCQACQRPQRGKSKQCHEHSPQ